MFDQAKVSITSPTSEIENSMTGAENAVSRLHSRLDALEDRVRPVIRATGSGANSVGSGVPREALSPLGDGIRSIGERVDHANDRIEMLLNSLAL